VLEITSKIIQFLLGMGLKARKSLLIFATIILCIILPVFVEFTNSHLQSLALVTHRRSPDEIQDLIEKAKILYQGGRYVEAVKLLQEAANSETSSVGSLQKAIILTNLSLAYQQLGLLKDAERAIAQSMRILEKLPASTQRWQIVAQALDVQGKLEFTQGKAELAITIWKRAGNIYEKIGDKKSLVRNYINSSQALQSLGFFSQASKVLSKVKENLNTETDMKLKAMGLRSLGNTLQVIGDLNESIKILKDALFAAKVNSSNAEISETLFSLGNTARAQKNYEKALQYYQQAVTVSTDINTRIQARLNQLSLLIKKHDLAQALDLVTQIQPDINKLTYSRGSIYKKINFARNLTKLSIELSANETKKEFIKTSASILANAVKEAEYLQDKRAESYALGTLGEIYQKTKQFSEAQKLTEKALFIAKNINAPDIIYQWQWQIGRLYEQQLDTKAAIKAYIEAYNNLKLISGDLLAINPDTQFSFRENVEPVYRELVALLLKSQGKSEAKLQITPENLKQARNIIESLQVAEINNFFRFKCLEEKQELDTILDNKDETAAIIYPIILPESIDIILKLPNQDLYFYKTEINQHNIENILENLQESLTDVTLAQKVKAESQQIYDLLIKPLEVDLSKNKIQTLVFILDGRLRNIPMSVLYDKKQDKFLFEKYAIVLTPGLQLIDPQILQKVKIKVLTAGVSEKRIIDNQVFPALNNVPNELQNILKQVPKAEKLFNNYFTHNNLEKQLQNTSFSVVHLATHGEFSSDQDKTFIVTWNKLLKAKEFDILLRNSDQNTSKALELLVLSACKTAKSDKNAALGLAGVAVRAGARSTLATLWSVDDKSVVDLMIEFYKQLKSGVNKAEALQKAQKAVFSHEKRPYFWAPFVLLGNWL
jgi:CHAT domain-containing protein